MHTAIFALSGALAGLVLYTIYLVMVSHTSVTKARFAQELAEENSETLLRKVNELTARHSITLQALKESQGRHDGLWAETTLERKDYQTQAKKMSEEIAALHGQIYGLNDLIEMLLTDVHPALVDFRQECAEERQPALFALSSGA